MVLIVTVRTGLTTAAQRRLSLFLYFNKLLKVRLRSYCPLAFCTKDDTDFSFPQRRDPRCLEMKGITTPVPVTTVQQRTSSMTSAPLRNTSTVTHPSAHSSASRRTISTPQSPTSKPAEGKLTDASPVKSTAALLVSLSLLFFFNSWSCPLNENLFFMHTTSSSGQDRHHYHLMNWVAAVVA